MGRSEVTYLIRQSAGSQITERELESTVCALDVDLQGDEGIGACC